MLKQWKAEHEGEVAAAGSGLPADLLEAVKGVYERLQEAARAQVDQLRTEHQVAAQDAERVQDVLRAEARHLGSERDALGTELASVKVALARDQAASQKDAVLIAALEAERDGQAQRLADRAAEVRELADQLAEARRLFEHFLYASASQRQVVKRAYETRISRSEQEVAVLRAHLQESREALAVLRNDKNHLEHKVAEQLNAAREEARKLYEATEGLIGSREVASARQFELEMAEERLGKAQEENEKLSARVNELWGENAKLLKKLDAPTAKARGSKP